MPHIANKRSLVGHMIPLLKELQNSNKDLYNTIFDNPDKYTSLINAITKDSYIGSTYDLEALLQILDHTYDQDKNRNPQIFVDAFEENLRQSFNEWVAVFPLNYNRWSDQKNYRTNRWLVLNKYILAHPLQSYIKFRNFFYKNFELSTLDQRLVEHQRRMSGGLLFENPLLCIAVHASREVARQRGLDFFNYFRWLQDLFIVVAKRERKLFFEDHSDVRHYFLLNRKNGELERFPLWPDTRIRVAFDNDFLKQVRTNRFKIYAGLIFERNDKMFHRIYNALHFFSKGFNSDDTVSQLLFYVIALESIFSKDKYTPLRVTLADYVSLICATPPNRIDLHKDIRELYDRRSSIVHQGAHNVSKSDIDRAKDICADGIITALQMYVSYSQQGNLEAKFFDNLLKRKLVKR